MARYIIMVRGTWPIFLALASFGIANSLYSQNKAARPKEGLLTGRIYANADGSVLRAAASVEVYLLLLPGKLQDSKDADGGETAGSIYLKENTKALDLYKQQLATDRSPQMGVVPCMKEPYLLQPVLLKVVVWAQTHKRFSQIITTQADEDGTFAISLPVGTYIIIVGGDNGSADALWTEAPPRVTIKYRTHVKLKLSTPKRSCGVD